MKSARRLKLYDTKTKQKQVLSPTDHDKVCVYSCGPTVYQRAHIGNMRAYVFADTLNKAIRHLGHTPKHIINLTDVGHLTDDADEGEDKVERQAQQSQESAKDITKRYSDIFLDDIKKLNIPPKHYRFPRATEYIREQISLIKEIEKKGYTYDIEDGIYFDTTAYSAYGALGLPPSDDNEYARVQTTAGKKHFQDFALWKRTPKGVSRQQEWDSPWGKGFPGWHIECSAMAMHLLGKTIDIHTGGMDHIAIHHNNEIAQSESATEQVFAKIWMHAAFLTINDEKISKSLGNVYTVGDIEERGYSPLSLRYLFLQASYRTPLSFSFESLSAAEKALERLRQEYASLKTHFRFFSVKTDDTYRDAIDDAISDDLNTAKTIATMWDIVHDKTLSPNIKRNTLRYADRVLGIVTGTFKERTGRQPSSIPKEIQTLLRQRDEARANKDYTRSDTIRDNIQALGYKINDTENGSVAIKDNEN